MGLSGTGADDNSVLWLDPDGTVRVVAEGIRFANGIAMGYDEQYLFVYETTSCECNAYPIHDDGSLGAPHQDGPVLGTRHPQRPGPATAPRRAAQPPWPH